MSQSAKSQQQHLASTSKGKNRSTIAWEPLLIAGYIYIFFSLPLRIFKLNLGVAKSKVLSCNLHSSSINIYIDNRAEWIEVSIFKVIYLPRYLVSCLSSHSINILAVLLQYLNLLCTLLVKLCTSPVVLNYNPVGILMPSQMHIPSHIPCPIP